MERRAREVWRQLLDFGETNRLQQRDAKQTRQFLKELSNVLKDTTVHTTIMTEATQAITTFTPLSVLEIRFPIILMYRTEGRTDATSTEEKLPSDR